MRHEVLYEYDLPVEMLDEIPPTEEVLEVLYARSSDNYHLPILITRLRIVGAYPETSVIYRVFEINYVDVRQVHVKFTRGLATVLTITRIDGEKNIFNGVRNKPEEMRAALLTIRDSMIGKVGGEWKFLHRQNLLFDEYLLREQDAVLSSVPTIPSEDLFEDKEMPGIGCYESTETLFEHFPPEAPDSDVFEEEPPVQMEVEREIQSAAVNSRISRMVETAEHEGEEEKGEPDVPVNDATVLAQDSGVTNDQWNDEGKGDAMILPEKRSPKRSVNAGRLAKLATDTLAPAEEDDSEVYVTESTPAPAKQTKMQEEVASLLSKELDNLPVPVPEPKVSPAPPSLPTPLPRAAAPAAPPQVCPAAARSRSESPTLSLSITLEPNESVDETMIDACLDSLKLLRDTGVITEAEYKERCLSLFKRTGV